MLAAGFRGMERAREQACPGATAAHELQLESFFGARWHVTGRLFRWILSFPGCSKKCSTCVKMWKRGQVLESGDRASCVVRPESGCQALPML